MACAILTTEPPPHRVEKRLLRGAVDLGQQFEAGLAQLSQRALQIRTCRVIPALSLRRCGEAAADAINLAPPGVKLGEPGRGSGAESGQPPDRRWQDVVSQPGIDGAGLTPCGSARG